MNRIEIPLSKKKIVLLLIASVIFIGASFEVLRTNATTDGFKDLVAYAGIFLGCFALISAIKKLFEKKMGIIIENGTLVINPDSKQMLLLPMSDIKDFQEIKVFGNKLIGIMMQDYNKYINAQESTFKRGLMIKSIEMSGTPFSISAGIYKISHQELLTLLKGTLKDKS